MKYIVIDNTEMLLFPRHVDHAEFASRNGGANMVTSAGFVEHDATKGELYCFGESISLGIGSGKMDNRHLQIAMRV